MTNGTMKRILIVDDEQDLVEMAQRKLERNGYHVDVAFNGQEGMAKVQNEEFDLIVTDVVMPIMDGFTFYKQLKDGALTSKIPVIILTARSNMEGSFRALGVDDFLAKPFDGAKLLDKIESFVRKPEILKKKSKVYVCGTETAVVHEMSQILRDYGAKASVINEPFELIKQSYQIPPHIVLLNVLLDGVPSAEIIRALRVFHRLDDLKVITYTHVNEETCKDLKILEQLKEAKNDCMIAGATKYIGRYTLVSFMDSLREYLG